MRELHTVAAMRSTLQYLLSSDMPADYKAVLIETLTDALRNLEAASDEEPGSRPWQGEEAMQLERSLRGKVAKSWQHADEVLMQCALRLDRAPADVRDKATQLGVGASVDYALAKSRPRPQDDD